MCTINHCAMAMQLWDEYVAVATCLAEYLYENYHGVLLKNNQNKYRINMSSAASVKNLPIYIYQISHRISGKSFTAVTNVIYSNKLVLKYGQLKERMFIHLYILCLF